MARSISDARRLIASSTKSISNAGRLMGTAVLTVVSAGRMAKLAITARRVGYRIILP